MWWRNKKKPILKPTHIDLVMPGQCILRCKMCDIWKSDMAEDKNWLTFKEYKKLLSDIKRFVATPFMISFAGGESLLYPDRLLDVVRLCSEFGFMTCFPTNAYLIDENMSKKIAKAKVYCLGISLDSIDPKVHNFIRGREEVFNRAMAAIGHLKRNSPSTFINILTIIMGINLDKIVELTKWVYNNQNLQRIIFQAIQKPFGVKCPDNWYEYDEFAFLWPKDTTKANSVIDELITLRQSDTDGFKIANPIPQLKQFKTYFSSPGIFVKQTRCHMDNVMRIDSYGNVKMCEEMESLGNIRRNNIWEIWGSAKANEARGQISNCKKNCHLLINCYYNDDS